MLHKSFKFNKQRSSSKKTQVCPYHILFTSFYRHNKSNIFALIWYYATINMQTLSMCQCLFVHLISWASLWWMLSSLLQLWNTLHILHYALVNIHSFYLSKLINNWAGILIRLRVKTRMTTSISSEARRNQTSYLN